MCLKRFLAVLLAAAYLFSAALPIFAVSSVAIPTSAYADLDDIIKRKALGWVVKQAIKSSAKAAGRTATNEIKRRAKDPGTLDKAIGYAQKHMVRHPEDAQAARNLIAELQSTRSSIVPVAKNGAKKLIDTTAKYFQAPKKLQGFPSATRATPKTPKQGGGGLRERWKDTKGRIYEWDSQHGAVEKYSSNGRNHLGEFDHLTGKQLKPGDPTRSVEP